MSNPKKESMSSATTDAGEARLEQIAKRYAEEWFTNSGPQFDVEQVILRALRCAALSTPPADAGEALVKLLDSEANRVRLRMRTATDAAFDILDSELCAYINIRTKLAALPITKRVQHE